MAWVVDTSVVVDLLTGDDAATELFLQSLQIGTSEFWTPADTVLAHCLWHQFQVLRRQQQITG